MDYVYLQAKILVLRWAQDHHPEFSSLLTNQLACRARMQNFCAIYTMRVGKKKKQTKKKPFLKQLSNTLQANKGATVTLENNAWVSTSHRTKNKNHHRLRETVEDGAFILGVWLKSTSQSPHIGENKQCWYTRMELRLWSFGAAFLLAMCGNSSLWFLLLYHLEFLLKTF